jgi:hypothetical protein
MSRHKITRDVVNPFDLGDLLLLLVKHELRGEFRLRKKRQHGIVISYQENVFTWIDRYIGHS